MSDFYRGIKELEIPEGPIKLVLSFLISGSFLFGNPDIFDIAEKYNKKKKSLVGLEVRKRQILADLYKIEKDTEKIVVKKSELNERNVRLNFQLKKISKKIVEIESRLEELGPKISEHMSSLDQISELPWFYALLQSENLADFDHLYKTLKGFSDIQAKDFGDFALLRTQLDGKKRELEKTAVEIVALQKDILKEEKKIDLSQTQKKKLLKSIDSRLIQETIRLRYLRSLGNRTAENSKLSDLKILFGTSFFDKKGQLVAPVEGSLVHGFGLNRLLNGDQIEVFHKGHFYKPFQTESRVKAVASGVVRSSKKMAGLGWTVIIDHGGHYYTVYANMNPSARRRGESVQAGEPIGSLGVKHFLFGTGLYFEVRHFSEPQNPEKWLKKDNGKLANIQRREYL